MKHACPFCGCYFGDLGITGGAIPGTRWTVEGLVDKVARLSRELRICRQRAKGRI